jgi:hypothetical protein
LAAVIGTIYATVGATTFRWTALPMIAIYVLLGLVLVSLFAMARGWRFPGMPEPVQPVPPVEHGRPSTAWVRREPGFPRAYRFLGRQCGR